MACTMGFSDETKGQAAEAFMKLFALFMERDATLIEINPFSEDREGRGRRVVKSGSEVYSAWFYAV